VLERDMPPDYGVMWIYISDTISSISPEIPVACYWKKWSLFSEIDGAFHILVAK
jgi:hypothetical protein